MKQYQLRIFQQHYKTLFYITSKISAHEKHSNIEDRVITGIWQGVKLLHPLLQPMIIYDPNHSLLINKREPQWVLNTQYRSWLCHHLAYMKAAFQLRNHSSNTR